MNFDETERYLFSLGNEVETMKLGLENIRKLLKALGNPQNAYKKVQVAGTNGKGSVCAFLDSICLQAKIHTGRYTSPHLISITERVKIDGVDISESEFARLATRVRETSERLVADGELERVPTFFEQVTAIALVAFAEAKVELAILETGLGGRFDAVTAANAEIAVITRIDLDHQEYLGDTIEKIAAEKAATIREDSKIVVGQQDSKAKRVILGKCHELGVEPKRATSEVVTKKNGDPTYPIYTHTFVTTRHTYPRIDSGLLGLHQAENAAVAIGVAETLQDEKFDISPDDICLGLETARHPGRLERHGRFLFDGAHNIGGTKALKRFLDDFVEGPITLLFGAMNGKDIAQMAELLVPLAETVVLTRPENSRAMPSAQLAAIARSFGSQNIRETNSVAEAIKIAQDVTPPGGTILVTGSLYLVGETKRLLKSEPPI